MLLVVGITFVIVASFVHAFYAVNAKVDRANAAGLYRSSAEGLIVSAIALLLSGTLFIWAASGAVYAGIAVAVYVFVLPLIMMPLAESIGMILKQSKWMTDAQMQEYRFVNLMCGACGVQLSSPTHSVEQADVGPMHWRCDNCASC